MLNLFINHILIWGVSFACILEENTHSHSHTHTQNFTGYVHWVRESNTSRFWGSYICYFKSSSLEFIIEKLSYFKSNWGLNNFIQTKTVQENLHIQPSGI